MVHPKYLCDRRYQSVRISWTAAEAVWNSSVGNSSLIRQKSLLLIGLFGGIYRWHVTGADSVMSPNGMAYDSPSSTAAGLNLAYCRRSKLTVDDRKDGTDKDGPNSKPLHIISPPQREVRCRFHQW